MSIETVFDIPFVAALALKEKQIQQNYRPLIAVHKWFARRPGTLFRALVLSEFGDGPLAAEYFKSHQLNGRMVADPFMGGGTPIVEANRLGCDVTGADINPMSYWIVREQLEHLDLRAYRSHAQEVLRQITGDVGNLYLTDCPIYGTTDVPVKYFLWVKTLDCERCARVFDLFPGYLLAEDTRHPTHVLVCNTCGELNEVSDPRSGAPCRTCAKPLRLDGPARRNQCACPHCGTPNRYPRPEAGPLRHRLFAIEYYNPAMKGQHRGRFFKKPDGRDLERTLRAAEQLQALRTQFVPDDEIPTGDETDRLHRWGYRRYAELFSNRQLLSLELLCRHVAAVEEPRVRAALATNLSDLLRYQNLLCRYDTMALKSLDIFSIHGFPVGLVQCESNVLGISNGAGTSVGSGGWKNIIDKYAKAKAYCDAPFEVRQHGSRKVQVPVHGEWIGERFDGRPQRAVLLKCQSSTELELEPQSLDAVFTDPPYFENVQYGELMDFCYVWLKQLVGSDCPVMRLPSARSSEELTGNTTASRDLAHFTDGLAAVFGNMARALKPGRPLAFTFHHNRAEAYGPIAVAILDAGLNCVASLPCPAEMGGSIHIHGTNSSIVDTVFVCRDIDTTRQKDRFETSDALVAVVAEDLMALRQGQVKPTNGDRRCVLLGHLTRRAVEALRTTWMSGAETEEKLATVIRELRAFGSPDELVDQVRQQEQAHLSQLPSPQPRTLFDAVPV